MGISRQDSDKTALLVYCTREEANHIRAAAKRERRTISGFVMNAVMNRFAIEGRIRERKSERQVNQPDPARKPAAVHNDV